MQSYIDNQTTALETLRVPYTFRNSQNFMIFSSQMVKQDVHIYHPT